MKINAYTLPENVINLMKEQLENSHKTNLEFGFMMCANKDNIIEAKNITRRTEKEVFIERGCPSGFKPIGTYHTHPSEISRASPGDLLNTCDHIADCIGGGTDNKIKCYVRKKEIDPIDCTKEFSELASIELDLKVKAADITKQSEILLKERKRLSAIKTRTRDTDIELREISRKIKERNIDANKFNREMVSFDQTLLKLQNKHFEEIQIYKYINRQS